MKTVKENFEQIVENNNALVETLSGNMQKFTALFETDQELEQLLKDAIEANIEQGKAYFNDIIPSTDNTKEKPLEQIEDAYNKFMDLQTELYNINSGFFKSFMDHFSIEKSSDLAKEASELYTSNMSAMVETSTTNFKLFQSFWATQN